MTIRKLGVRTLLLVMSVSLILVLAPYLQINTQADPETPESVAHAYFIALRENNWDLVCELMHPEAIDKLRNLILPIALEADRSGGGEEFFELIFGDVDDINKLSQLNLQQFCVSFFKGQTLAFALEGLSNSEIMTLGYVNEGPEVAHVVYRMNLRFDDFGDDDINITMTQIAVISLQRYGSEWRVLLTGEVEGIAQMLQVFRMDMDN
ncbi:MAG: hypothetical protein ACE5JP_12635 [Candidatus Bipolaricaulia bacterium]